MVFKLNNYLQCYLSQGITFSGIEDKQLPPKFTCVQDITSNFMKYLSQINYVTELGKHAATWASLTGENS